MLSRVKRRGAAAIEFALWITPLMVLFSGIVDLSWYMSRYHLVQRATMDGVRFGIRQASYEPLSAPGSLQTAEAEERAQTMLNDFNLAGTTTATFYQDDPFDRLELRTVVPFQPLIGMLPMPSDIKTEFNMMSELQRCLVGDCPCPAGSCN